MFLRIVLIGSRYYYRVRIPKDLLIHFPSPEIKKSLKTTDIKAARILASNFDEQVQSTFAVLRTARISHFGNYRTQNGNGSATIGQTIGHKLIATQATIT